MEIFIAICMVLALGLLVELTLVVIYLFTALLSREANYWRGLGYKAFRRQRGSRK